MNERVQIPKSSKAFEFRLKMFTISYFALAIFVAIMIFNLSRSLNFNEFWDLIFTSILICGLYFLFATIMWYQWGGIKYYLTSHALIVKQRVGGMFASYTEEIYTLNTIRSAKISQSGYAQKNGYGDITVYIGNSEKEVVLKDVDRPAELSGKISRSIGVTTYQQHSK